MFDEYVGGLILIYIYMDRLIDRETDICVYHVCAYILRERERD